MSADTRGKRKVETATDGAGEVAARDGDAAADPELARPRFPLPLLLAILESSDSAVFVHRASDGALVERNSRALELFELAAEEAEGFTLALALVDEGSRPAKERLDRLVSRLELGEGLTAEREVCTPSGRVFWAEIRVRRLEVDGEEFLLTVVRDIDERKRTEQELQGKLRELQEAFSLVGHELKGPFYALESQMHRLQRQPKEVQAACKEMADALEWIRVFIEDLQKFTAAGESVKDEHRQPIPTEEFLKALLPSANPKGFPVEVEFQKGLPPLHGDPLKLTEVFRHLLENSVKHRETGSKKVRISVSYKGRAPKGEFCLADEGRGMEPEHLGRIFETGFTMGERGTGFGLPTVKRIVEAHGGEIRAESDGLGKGTRIYLRLPRVGRR